MTKGRRNFLIIACAVALMILAVACAVKVATTSRRLPPPAPPSAAVRVGPDYLYPNPSLTPGKFDELDAAKLKDSYSCPPSIHKSSCTYSEAHRDVSDAGHRAVYDAYAVPPAGRNGKAGEVDHFYPLCAGGANDKQNLWYQPAVNEWNGRNFGFHEKDALESWVCREIKAGRLEPRTAYERITRDWVAFYLEANVKRSRASVY